MFLSLVFLDGITVFSGWDLSLFLTMYLGGVLPVSNCSFCCLPARPDFPSLVDSLVSDDRIAMTIRPHSALAHYNLLLSALPCIYSAPRALLEYGNCKLQCTQGIRVQYSSCKLQCIQGYPPMCGPQRYNTEGVLQGRVQFCTLRLKREVI